MRSVAFGEALTAGTRLTLFSDDKPDRFFTVIKFWMDATSGVALELKTGVPTYQVEDEEGRVHLLIHLAIEEQNEHRWCLWRPDQTGFDSRAIFGGALIERYEIVLMSEPIILEPRSFMNRQGGRFDEPQGQCESLTSLSFDPERRDA